MTVKLLQDKYELRIKAADNDKKVKRKEYVMQRRLIVRREEAKDGPCYQAGGF